MNAPSTLMWLIVPVGVWIASAIASPGNPRLKFLVALSYGAVFLGFVALTDVNLIQINKGIFWTIAMIVSLAAGFILGARSKDGGFSWAAFGTAACGIALTKLSTQSGSATGWADWIHTVLGWPMPMADEAVHWVRRGIHFCIYGVVATASFGLLRECGARSRPLQIAALLWALSHGVFDEVRQSTFPDRMGRAQDVAVDAGGILTALAILRRYA